MLKTRYGNHYVNHFLFRMKVRCKFLVDKTVIISSLEIQSFNKAKDLFMKYRLRTKVLGLGLMNPQKYERLKINYLAVNSIIIVLCTKV